MPNKVLQIPIDDTRIVAPCGLNCSVCRAYKRERQPCPGCRGEDGNKSASCLACAIRNCDALASGGHRFCFSCEKFPCTNLRHLDQRYRTKYAVSVIGNLQRIQAVGAAQFVAEEAARWACPQCGARLCMHQPQCVNCGRTRNI